MRLHTIIPNNKHDNSMIWIGLAIVKYYHWGEKALQNTCKELGGFSKTNRVKITNKLEFKFLQRCICSNPTKAQGLAMCPKLLLSPWCYRAGAANGTVAVWHGCTHWHLVSVRSRLWRHFLATMKKLPWSLMVPLSHIKLTGQIKPLALLKMTWKRYSSKIRVILFWNLATNF